MAKNRKNMIIRIQDWIESVSGQTFLNYAYSWGAAVVILGALFKLTHIPGANAMLFIGMGTEVLVFFISGFDRPAGLKREEELMSSASDEEGWDEEAASENETENFPEAAQGEAGQPVVLGGGVSQPIVVGGPVVVGGSGEVPLSGVSSVNPEATVAAGGGPQGAQGGAGQQAVDIKALADMVNASNAELFAKVLEDARNASTPEMKEAAENYVEELKTLTETLARVSEQAEHMTRDAKEMDNLNRTLTGINTIYEMQLKSISTQVGTIDQINEQTRKMARQIEELNGIYNRMIQALTVNMKHTPGGSAAE